MIQVFQNPVIVQHSRQVFQFELEKDPPDDGGDENDSGAGGDSEDDGDETPGADLDLHGRRPRKELVIRF